ncbi:hypothetical protein [Spirosoma areae]
MTDIARRAGYKDVTLFQCLLTPDDWIDMIRLGWVPYRKLLNPPVVKFIMDKFVTDYEETKE